jgi:hypothetical protein
MSKPSAKTKKNDEEILAPAFENNAQAFCFLALIVFALALPFFITESGLISRRDSYDLMPENQGAFSFVKNEIFESREDIDLLFLGSSIIFANVDTPQVQRDLSAALGRPARVVTFGHYFNSADIPYMQMRDLLARKRVRMVIFSVPREAFTEGPSPTVYRFMRYGDDRELFDRLPLESKISLYACGVLRAPRDLLTLTRKNRTKPSPFAENLGADKADFAWGRAPEKFKKFSPPAPSLPASEMISTAAAGDYFQFTNDEVAAHQFYYLESLVELLRRHETALAIINFPMYSERRSPKITERKDWSKVFGAEIPLLGVQPSVLFQGLSDEEIEKLYYDDDHFNTNGNEFFTRAIMPAILEVYEKNAAKNF